MIEVENISKMYGEVRAVDNLSFQVEKGQILGFLGANGAGKTTTMRMITGALPPTSGTAKIAGYDILDSPMDVKRRVGYLPETPPLYMDLSVKAYLSFVAKIKQISGSERDQRIQWAIGRCGLSHVSNRMVGNLSKGYRQRVGLAQAILNKPDVLILDEPTVGLDPSQIRDIRALIKELSEHHTIILSTHILPEVSMICDRATIISHGKIVLEGSITDITKERSLEEVFISLISSDGSSLSEASAEGGQKNSNIEDAPHRGEQGEES